MDSLRYWVTEMHVDGFRFDRGQRPGARAATRSTSCGRAFFDIIHQDVMLSQREGFDRGAVGPGRGSGIIRSGTSRVGWTEWNGKYRDAVRRFWKGEGPGVAELATRLSGSSDLYEHNGRRPYASINFVTCHDGFTLHDLVSYNGKHNEANGEGNKDGNGRQQQLELRRGGSD